MGLVDIDEQFYPCPHCDGYIRARLQFPYDDYGCSVTIYHKDEFGNEVELPELKDFRE